MEIASKLLNALGGFWDSLEDEERRLVVYAGVYLLAALAVSAQRSREQRFRQAIVEELRNGSSA